MENKKYAIITYLLDENGRRDSLLKGGDGKEKQSYKVELNERIIKLADISEDGRVTLKVGFSGGQNLDSVEVDYKIAPEKLTITENII